MDKALLAMRRLNLVWVVLALLIPSSVNAQFEPTIRIASPASGEVLLAQVAIMGTSAVEGFFSSEISFTYASDPSNTWFLIHAADVPVSDGLLWVWDTSLVTDGDYDLRLRVSLQDGTLMESIVTGVHIRNQSPTGTPTPVPTHTPQPIDTSTSAPLPPTPQPAFTATNPATPTDFPPNPAVLTSSDIRDSLGRGILTTLLVFLLVVILFRLRR